ncbi:hypothetical protein NOJ05_18235 [Neorhizobium galegae]|uniref:hypothetical protein n=1 Tax=Neorhizobium galegae TaxID=399 RepID=UPI002103299A|nr:hypothetical protein [Neorhizobium galegae]MCQ1779146.1 hypothetical protein [Neorhizobium galegae]MCQ1799442.1 hypothetical protein [Neorhizobium galegae]
MQVDLKAQMIPAAVRCWRLFPGSSYRFLETFKNDSVAFLDMPGFQMPDAPLAKINDLAKRIRVAEITLDKIGKDGKHKEHFVSQDDIEKFRVGRKRQRNQYAMINLFDHAQKGDLVIMPEPLGRGKVQIGVFNDDAGTHIMAESPKYYGVTGVPARRVQWVREVDENKLSTILSSSLRHQHPFSLIEQSLFFEIFSLTFDSYVYKDQFSSVIFNRKDDYTDRETALIGIISSLAANFAQAVDEDQEAEIDALTAILSQASMEFHCAQAADIHSPGFNRFTSSKHTALVIAAVIAALSLLSSCNNAQQVEASIPQLEFVNSSAPQDDDCTGLVSKTSKRLLRGMDSDNLFKLCQAMKDAERRAGLESSAKTHR